MSYPVWMRSSDFSYCLLLFYQKRTQLWRHSPEKEGLLKKRVLLTILRSKTNDWTRWRCRERNWSIIFSKVLRWIFGKRWSQRTYSYLRLKADCGTALKLGKMASWSWNIDIWSKDTIDILCCAKGDNYVHNSSSKCSTGTLNIT